MTATDDTMASEAGTGGADAAPPEGVTVLADLRSHLRKSKAGISGIIICSLFALVAILGPWLPLIKDPTKQSLPDRLTPPVGWGGTWAHPLGTDQLGRDILARLIDGARISLLVSVTAVIIAAILGTVLGLVAGYIGGRIDTLIVSAADVQMAFPGVLAGLILVAAFGPSVWLVIIVVAISSWMVFTRVGRNLVLTLKTSLFVEASELSGTPSSRVMWRHLLPNLVSSL
ncbi:MAG: ABC transporter permease, partial [Acidimicrobiaceae bacterium]|nr:ABC transporter permease [Acidimicrobiaceae bacterium]